MKFIVKALIYLAVMLSFTANAAEYKEYPQGEITYYKYLPRNGWTLPAGYTVEQFSSAIYKGQIRNNFPGQISSSCVGTGYFSWPTKSIKPGMFFRWIIRD